MSLVIIDNRNKYMEEEDLIVIKPHYIDRFQKQSILKLPKPKQQPKHTERKLTHKVKTQKRTLNQQILQNKIKETMKMKLQLLKMIKECRQQEEIELNLKRLYVSRVNREQKEMVEEISMKMAALKKQIYELYRHNCGNQKEKLCTFCKQRQKAYKEQILSFLEEDKKQFEQQAVFKDTINRVQPAGKSIERNIYNTFTTKNPQSKFNTQNNYKYQYQTLNLQSKNNNQEPRKSQRSSTFRINRKTEKIKSMRKKGFQNQFQVSISENNSPSFSNESQKNKKKSVFNLENKIQSSKPQSNLNELQAECNVNQSSKLMNEQQLENHKSKRSFRKSIIRLAQDVQYSDLQSHSGQKSKFYDIKVENKVKKSQPNEIVGSYRHLKSSYGRKEEETQQYKVLREKPKQKNGSYQRTKNLKKSQIYMDLTDIQSSKNIEKEVVHRQREEIQQLIRQRENSIDNAQSKLSRYQRERLIYGYLKKQLVRMGCVDEQSEAADQLYCSHNESQISIKSQQASQKYSIKDRKQSLLSKLNIFNQSVNFQDMKTKIQTVITEKQALGQNLIENTQILINHAKGRREQKIVEKFLAEVLKINDLKRLLRKKFSKELDWSPKMREMHQFYTYLEFNLQNFRMNLSKNTENNWKKLTLQGKGEEFCLDQLKITENIGRYKGLENTEITEFQHHKEIECSMRYYGIEVKRLQQLQNFFYAPPQRPQSDLEKVKQKSLKQIKQCDFFVSLDLKGKNQ